MRASKPPRVIAEAAEAFGGGPESRVVTREEWRKEIGPFWEDATDEAVERGLAFVIFGGKSGPTPPKTSRGPRTSGRSRPTGESTPPEDDIFDDVTDTVGGIIISGVRPGASFEKPNPPDYRRRSGPRASPT